MTKECRLCRNRNSRFVFKSINTHGRHIVDKKQNFSVYRCNVCDSIFLAKIKTDSKYYLDSYDTNYYVDSHSPSFVERLWSIFSKTFFLVRLSFLKSLVPHKEKIKILDIGSGNGDFLSQLPEKKFQKYGLEINPDGIDRSRTKGIVIFDKPIEKINFGKTKFDLITLWHVFEHLENPILTLQKINRILSKRGVLVIQVPNSRSLGFTMGKKNWFHLDSPRHLQIPSVKSMKYVLNKTNFRLVKVRNDFFDYPLDLFWSVRQSKFRYLVYLFYPLIKVFSKEHLTYIIKKRIK